jgi:hypothetical protein
LKKYNQIVADIILYHATDSVLSCYDYILSMILPYKKLGMAFLKT